MCNNLHPDSKKIPLSGIGWKIFYPYDLYPFVDYPSKKTVLIALFTRSSYELNHGETAIWNSSMEANSGFCFFLSKEEAEKALIALKEYNDVFFKDSVIVKITYEEGLGSHEENSIINGKSFHTAICKKFRLHRDSKQKYSL